MQMWKTLLLITIVLLVADIAFGQGCSQCKLIAEQSTANFNEVDESSFGHNINYGILLMMTVPYILLFVFFRKRIFRLFRSLTSKP